MRWLNKDCRLSILIDIQTLAWTWTWTDKPPCLSRGDQTRWSPGPLPPQPFCHAYIGDNRLTLSLEEKDNRIHVGPEEIQESSWPGSWGQWLNSCWEWLSWSSWKARPEAKVFPFMVMNCMTLRNKFLEERYSFSHTEPLTLSLQKVSIFTSLY